MRAAASYDSFVCSGNCRQAPRCPIEKSVFSKGPFEHCWRASFYRKVTTDGAAGIAS